MDAPLHLASELLAKEVRKLALLAEYSIREQELLHLRIARPGRVVRVRRGECCGLKKFGVGKGDASTSGLMASIAATTSWESGSSVSISRFFFPPILERECPISRGAIAKFSQQQPPLPKYFSQG